MIYVLVFGGLIVFLGLATLADYLRMPWGERERKYPKGYIREYDPTGINTYKD